MNITNKEIIATKRDFAYENFRQFVGDSGQTGETLASSAPVKLKGTKSLISRRTYLVRLAYKPETTVSAISLIVPPEISWAAGYVPFNWEMFASLLASHSRIIDITNKGSNPTPRCSFINALKGAYLEGILPPPQAIISSSAYCEGVSYVFEELAHEFKVPQFHLDIPAYLNDSSVENMAFQLQEAFEGLCKINHIDKAEGEKRLRETMYHSTIAKSHYMDIMQIRRDYGPLNLGLEPLNWHFLFLTFWGDESGARICEALKNDILQIAQQKNGKEDKSLPLAMFSLIEYGRTNIWKKLVEQNAYSTFEGANYLGDYLLPEPEAIQKAPVKELFHNLAYNTVNTPMRGGDVKGWTNKYMEDAKATGAKGLIIFSHEQCQMLAPRLHEVEKQAVQNGLKVVSLNGDCILGIPPGPAGIRLGTFLSSLTYKQDNAAKEIKKKEEKVIQAPVWRVGIDFGSGFSKFTVIDEHSNIIEHDMITSGIDYNTILENIRTKIHAKTGYSMAISGVGGDNPRFKELVEVQTTEINALINAIRMLYSNEEDFMVVDIGTQDVKVLKFHNMEEAPWLNTNKSCGAGTGMVLVQILERWKQSMPEMTFKEIDELAMQATSGELINTTCGIFAVTNVISALVQGNEERRKTILKGVYQYLATQAIRLLPAEDQKGGKVLLTGGLANHKSLQQVFMEQGYELLPVPENLHPQYFVAYGTALAI